MNDRVRDLFAVEPAQFVQARDALAKELRAAGNEAEAKEVSGLRRPTAAVWAVNQLARKNRAVVEEFLDASEQVRRAQLRGASGDELRIAMAAQRGALAKLEEAAADVLRSAGTDASPGALRTIQSTLQAAAAGPSEVRRELLEGTLREAMVPTGFDALLGAGPVRAGHRVRAGAADGGEKQAARQAKEDRRAAEREAKRQRATARKRAAAVRAAEARLRAMEQKAKKADADAQKARERVEAARAALERLRS
ncbi:MAG TPA: hypothetical protein VE620_11920 [Myxococcales bacterium]|nr:hypothetical protein [Myxococcales bacterium]